jgi:hypothetical protein
MSVALLFVIFLEVMVVFCKTAINTTSMFKVLVQLTNIQHVKPSKDGGISTLDVFSLP